MKHTFWPFRWNFAWKIRVPNYSSIGQIWDIFGGGWAWPPISGHFGSIVSNITLKTAVNLTIIIILQNILISNYRIQMIFACPTRVCRTRVKYKPYNYEIHPKEHKVCQRFNPFFKINNMSTRFMNKFQNQHRQHRQHSIIIAKLCETVMTCICNTVCCRMLTKHPFSHSLSNILRNTRINCDVM